MWFIYWAICDHAIVGFWGACPRFGGGINSTCIRAQHHKVGGLTFAEAPLRSIHLHAAFAKTAESAGRYWEGICQDRCLNKMLFRFAWNVVAVILHMAVIKVSTVFTSACWASNFFPPLRPISQTDLAKACTETNVQVNMIPKGLTTCPCFLVLCSRLPSQNCLSGTHSCGPANFQVDEHVQNT